MVSYLERILKVYFLLFLKNIAQGGGQGASCRESREAGQHREAKLLHSEGVRRRGQITKEGGKTMLPVGLEYGYMADRTLNAISVFGTLGNNMSFFVF